MKYKGFIIFLFSVMCVSCAKPKKQLVYTYITTHSVPGKQINQNAQIELAETTVQTSRALEKLSAIQLATHPDLDLDKPLDPKLLGMDQSLFLDWNGPPEPVLREVAKISQYQLNVLGTEPSIPPLVNIHKSHTLLADILRDISYQIGHKASITVYPDQKIIELRYHKNT
jgi:defect-in-organelle-trafficking protein DotD